MLAARLQREEEAAAAAAASGNSNGGMMMAEARARGRAEGWGGGGGGGGRGAPPPRRDDDVDVELDDLAANRRRDAAIAAAAAGRDMLSAGGLIFGGGARGGGGGGGRRRDDEDADAALARALAEEETEAAARHHGDGGRAPSGRDATAADDEALARALQEEEDAGWAAAPAPPPAPGASFVPPSPVPVRSVPPGHCPGCERSTAWTGGISAMGRTWHPTCFTCAGCRRVIAEPSFATRDGVAYHKSCFRELFHPKCVVCDVFIPADRSGSVKFLTHPYWGDVFCPTHDDDGTRRCDGCDRLERRGTSENQFGELPDGRALCIECASTAVIDSASDAPPLYDDVCLFFESKDMPLLPQRPPLHLGAFYTLVPMRPRSRGERRSLRTFAIVSLRPPLAFNPDTPRRLSTPSDAFQLHPDIRSYGTTLSPARDAQRRGRRRGVASRPNRAHARSVHVPGAPHPNRGARAERERREGI